MELISSRLLDLAHEFRGRPIGRHSPDLQHLLNVMRQPSGDPFYIIVTVAPGEKWRLALMPDGGSPVPEFQGIEFDSMEKAEWHVFKIRLEALTGKTLEITQ